MLIDIMEDYMTNEANAAHDYLAFILIGGGSCWGRSPDKEEAIQNAMKSLKDWDRYYEVYDVDVRINVIDVTGYAQVWWDDDGIFGQRKGEEDPQPEKITNPIERITRRTPANKKKGKKIGYTSRVREFNL